MPVENLLADLLGQLSYFDGAALVVAATNESLLLERREMLVHRRERGELQRVRDLLEARRVAVLVDEANEVVQYFFLPFCQCHRKSPTGSVLASFTVGEPKAKVNGTV